MLSNHSVKSKCFPLNINYTYSNNVYSESTLLTAGDLELPSVKPGDAATLPLPKHSTSTESVSDVYITISLRLRHQESWAEANHEIAWAQHKLASVEGTTRTTSSQAKLSMTESQSTITVQGAGFQFTFNKARGLLTSWKRGDEELLDTDPTTGGALIVSSWRPTTDNDAPVSLPYWNRFGVDQLTSQLRSFKASSSNDGEFVLSTKSFLTPPVLAWGWECDMVYTISSAGALAVRVESLKPTGTIPEHVPRIGLNLRLRKVFNRTKWYGRGPGETYPDSKSSQRIGVWSAESLDELHTPYDVPQENGNRMDSKWLKIMSQDMQSSGIRMRRLATDDQDDDAFSFAVSKYSPATIQNAEHPFDLHDDNVTFVRLDAKVAGLGTQSCGPPVADDKLVQCKEERFAFELQYI